MRASAASINFLNIMLTEAAFSLPSLTKYQKSKMLAYAEQVLSSQQAMTSSSGKNILHHTLEKKTRHVQMDHYPKGDRIDKRTGAQYFYHCHREDLDLNEHGHFHCFLRYKHIPQYRKPKPLEDWKKYLDNPMTHLVAISMDRFGQPMRLFTVNRWVTSEIWYDAEHVPSFIKRFQMTLTDNPYWQVLDQWVEGMLKLFLPQITWLHHQRDAAMKHHKLVSPQSNTYEDRDIEVLSEIPIDLKHQIEWIIHS